MRADDALMDWIRNESQNTIPSGASITTHFSGLPYSVTPSWVSILPLPRLATAAL